MYKWLLHDAAHAIMEKSKKMIQNMQLLPHKLSVVVLFAFACNVYKHLQARDECLCEREINVFVSLK